MKEVLDNNFIMTSGREVRECVFRDGVASRVSSRSTPTHTLTLTVTLIHRHRMHMQMHSHMYCHVLIEVTHSQVRGEELS